MSQLQLTQNEHHTSVSSIPSTQISPHSVEHQNYEALSRPPSYMMPNGNQTGAPGETEQTHSEIVRELADYYSRENIRNHYLDRLLFWNTGNDDDNREKIKYKYALQSCISSQFRGTPFLIWSIIFIFIGCISVFAGPTGALALWALLGVYFVLAFIAFQNRRKEAKKIDDLERRITDLRTRRQELLGHSHPLPEGYYFEIHNHTKDHAHPVVTLLPPPPAYAN